VDTTERLLALLGLLQRRPDWSAEELAERLDITTRTIRRDVTRLRPSSDLLALPWPFEVTEPPELRAQIRKQTKAIAARHARVCPT
jgi:DeoR/GlpR family transcriptional regulator of sugar metabolism